MSKIIFLNEPEKVYDGAFSQIGKNQVRLIFTSEVPSKEILVSGFNLVNEHNGSVQTIRTDYIYIYRTYEDNPNKIELCNDNIPWADMKYTVKFTVGYGGTIEGKTKQEVNNYKDLVIPIVQTESGFEFKGWKPEIPSEGVVSEDKTFHAMIVDKNVYFYAEEFGSLIGESKQAVDNYNELVIPEIVADEGYSFMGWEPEIPSEGKIDENNTNFSAVFKSNVSDRLTFVENDLTDTQLGLVENYDFALAMAEEITDLQLALVEIYDLIMGGM